MSASDIAAWWGASIATLVLLIDLIKWASSGARITVKATPNMQNLGVANRPDPETNIFVEAVNSGDKLTTITHLAAYHFKSRLHALLNRPMGQGAVIDTGTAQRLPFELAPGQRWVGLIDQDDLSKKFPGALVYCGVLHTGSKKPCIRRVELK